MVMQLSVPNGPQPSQNPPLVQWNPCKYYSIEQRPSKPGELYKPDNTPQVNANVKTDRIKNDFFFTLVCCYSFHCFIFFILLYVFRPLLRWRVLWPPPLSLPPRPPLEASAAYVQAWHLYPSFPSSSDQEDPLKVNNPHLYLRIHLQTKYDWKAEKTQQISVWIDYNISSADYMQMHCHW